jgi:WD40 repeat protein
MGCVRDVHFNPNRAYTLATGGDDTAVRVWDTRNVRQPLRTVNEHSHWCVRVRAFTRTHTQGVVCSLQQHARSTGAHM